MRLALARTLAAVVLVAGFSAPALAQVEVGASLVGVSFLSKTGGSTITAIGRRRRSLAGLFTPGTYVSVFFTRHVAGEGNVAFLSVFGDGESFHMVTAGGQIDWFMKGDQGSSPYVLAERASCTRPIPVRSKPTAPAAAIVSSSEIGWRCGCKDATPESAATPATSLTSACPSEACSESTSPVTGPGPGAEVARLGHHGGVFSNLDDLFHQALDAIDAGDVPALERLLRESSELVHKRLTRPGSGCRTRWAGACPAFSRTRTCSGSSPKTAPRQRTLPANIVERRASIIDAAKRERVASLQEQLSSRCAWWPGRAWPADAACRFR
jgi:hypothetical protein